MKFYTYTSNTLISHILHFRSRVSGKHYLISIPNWKTPYLTINYEVFWGFFFFFNIFRLVTRKGLSHPSESTITLIICSVAFSGIRVLPIGSLWLVRGVLCRIQIGSIPWFPLEDAELCRQHRFIWRGGFGLVCLFAPGLSGITKQGHDCWTPAVAGSYGRREEFMGVSDAEATQQWGGEAWWLYTRGIMQKENADWGAKGVPQKQ